MELRLTLILLCVSSSLSIEDNEMDEMEGLPISDCNVSSSDGLSTSDHNVSIEVLNIDGLPISDCNVSSSDGLPISDPNVSIEVLNIDGLPTSGFIYTFLVAGYMPMVDQVPMVNSEVVVYKGPNNYPGNETTMKNKTFLHEFQEYMNSWWVTKLVPSIYTVVFLVALPLNIMAIIMLLVKVKVKNPAVVYLLNLATADVLFVSILPFHIVYRFSGNNWMVGEGMCQFVMSMYLINMRVSILLMTSISVDRFLALVYPLQSLSWRTVRRAWLVCCCIWVISIVSTVPILIVKQTRPFPELNITTCSDVQDAELVERFQVYYYFPIFIVLLYLLPLIITTFCYTGIVRGLSMKGAQKRSRAVLLTVVVLCVFVLCFGPANVIWFMHFLQVYNQASNFLYMVYIISVSVSSVSCCLDPLIYYYVSSEWQRHVYSLLGCKREQTPPVDH